MTKRIFKNEVWGKKINDISEIYKGDGVNTCRWCGNTGIMHTFSDDGYFYGDSYCFCKYGDELCKADKEEE